jgi:hypothetical protein
MHPTRMIRSRNARSMNALRGRAELTERAAVGVVGSAGRHHRVAVDVFAAPGGGAGFVTMRAVGTELVSRADLRCRTERETIVGTGAIGTGAIGSGRHAVTSISATWADGPINRLVAPTSTTAAPPGMSTRTRSSTSPHR